MKKWTVYFQLLLLTFFLSACTSQPQKAPSAKKPANKDIAWQQRQASFAKAKEWRLQGKVSVSHKGENWPFKISWLQRSGDNYEMNIKHPLTNSVLAYIKGSPQGVMLKAQDGKVYKDNNAENLLRRQLRVGLPLKGLKYWVRGIPSPDYPAAKTSLDEYGRPLTLLQAGWKIDYPVYQSGGSSALPEKITLVHSADNIRIKVIAKDWKTRY